MQVVKLPSGRYVVGVSGGLDSMVLLDMLRHLPDVELFVAHVNHGTRDDNEEDAKLVTSYAMSHNVPYVVERLTLGHNVDEAKARKARYNFLRRCRINQKAHAILVAHHADDVVETAIINTIRGTGWRGLAPFAGRSDILRPLQNYTKDQLLAYARKHNVPWREDTTNRDERYLRNYVRHTVIPTIDQRDSKGIAKILQYVSNQQQLRRTIEELLDELLQAWVDYKNASYSAARFCIIMLPPVLAYELLQHLLRRASGNSLERQLAEQAVIFIKVARPGKYMQLNGKFCLRVTGRHFIVEPTPSVVS